MRLCADLETNGLLDELDKVHCMAVADIDTGKEWTFTNRLYSAESDGTIEDGLDLLGCAKEIHGHNFAAFDRMALEKVYGWETNVTIVDTYILSMLAFPNLAARDFEMRRRQVKMGQEQFPGNLCGRHHLKAWGQRLGIHKGSYGDNRKDWSTFDVDMLNYCAQDVRVNVAVSKFLEKEQVPEPVRLTEQRFSYIMALQQLNGFRINVSACETLVATMQKDRAVLEAELDSLFPPKEIVYFTPKKKLRRTKTVVFNPASRQQIAANLTEKYGWEPTDYTDGGQAKVDEKVLSRLPYPEAEKLSRYLLLNKRIGQLADGPQAWLKQVKDDGRLHGRVVNIGTPHGRCGHTNPNMAQVPSVTKEYGKECRELFVPRRGWKLVGCDASGIQLRALAHYLGRHDGGEYIQVVTTGDPHTKNQEAAGLATRAEAKTFIYAFLFGAGDEKLGLQLGATPKDAKRVGRAAKAKFLKAIPALAALLQGLKSAGNKISGLDGRPIYLDKSHVALNFLLTAFEAAVMKRATVITYDRLAAEGLVFGEDYANVAHVHDEYEFECKPEYAELVGQTARAAIIQAGVDLGSRCPLDAEYRIGDNWYEVH